MGRIRFNALGALTLTAEGRELAVGGPRQRRLVAMLLIHRGTVVSVDRLADVVFAGEPTDAAATTLRSYVARLRKVLDGGGATVRTQAPGYLLDVADDAYDVACFERLVAAARAAAGRDDPVGAAAHLREALALWRGDAHAEFADEAWALPEAQRLGELRLVAQEALFDAELACGRAAELVAALEAAAREHPLRDGFRRQLMLALHRAGRQADALRAYQAHRELLAEELGLDPSPALQELEARILDHDPSLLLAEPAGEALRGYRLGARLGTGRDGTVCAARLPGVERDLVLRTIRPEVADDPAFVRTFEARAHRVARLRHPAIVPIHDYWREPGAAYVVLRRLRGGSLADRLERGPLSRAELAALVERVGGALVAASAAGVPHGRVSPANVLYDDDGAPHLTDFDLTDAAEDRGDADVRDLAALVRAAAPGLVVPEAPTVAELVGGLAVTLAAGGTGPAGAASNPYKGLRAFDEADAADFFGRDEVVAEVVDRLRRPGVDGRLVLVVGGSGTGKSSVVRAGVLPAIRAGAVPGSERWFLTTMLPGPAPWKELAAALQRVAVVEDEDLVDELAADPCGVDRVVRRVLPAGGHLLLVVDQLEELFTSTPDAEQAAFLEGLVEAVTAVDSRVRVLGTLRADFYDRPLAVRRFGPLVSAATVTIPAMAPAELEAAIVEPAQRAGRVVERALVAELVSAVAAEPAALPALQFALFELAEDGGRTITLEAYRSLGGVSGAIAARAEQLHQSLPADQQQLVRGLFERLVVVARDAEPTRRRATRSELTEGHGGVAVDDVIDEWAAARLLALDRHRQTREPTVELAHEALLRAWPRLRAWIDEDREALLTLGQLREAAAGWAALDRDPGALYRGARLQVALDVVERRADPLVGEPAEFLEASRAARDAEEQAAAELVDRQARANRRLKVQLVVIAVALVVAIVGGFVAVDQRGAARVAERTATVRELAAASAANLEEDPELAVLLALAAVEATGGGSDTRPEAVEALHEALAASRIALRIPGIGGDVDWSPDGSVFLTEGPEESGMVDLRDATTGETVTTFRGDDVDINEVAFSPDGSMVAVAGDDGTVGVFDRRSGDEVASLELGDGPVWGPSWSPDGSMVAASWNGPEAVGVFEVASGRLLHRFDERFTHATAFSPDGAIVAMGGDDDEQATLLDVATGTRVDGFVDDQDGINDIEFSPDGRWIATSSPDGSVVVYDAATRTLRFRMEEHTASVVELAWSPDATRLASVGDDGTAWVSTVGDGGIRPLLALSSRDTRPGLIGVAFSPDGERLLVGDLAVSNAVVWDVTPTGAAEVANFTSAIVARGSGTFVEDGSQLLLADPERGAVGFWDVETGRLDREIVIGEDRIGRLALSPDGEVLATVVDELPVDLWDARSGAPLGQAGPTRSDFVTDLSWSPDGAHLAVATAGSDRGGVMLVDRAGTEVRRILAPTDVYVNSVVFTPDGASVVTSEVSGRNDPTQSGFAVWDRATGDLVHRATGEAVDLAVDPIGEWLVTNRHLAGGAAVWALDGEEPLRTVTSSSTWYSVAVSPDGRRAASAGADGTISLWDPDTGAIDLVLRGHPSAVSNLAFSPDGTRLASIDEDGLVRVWTLVLDELVELAGSRVTRTLDDEECRRYLHVEACPAP